MPGEISQHILVYVTTPNFETAELIAKSSVERRLAAGANIVTGVKSIFHWKGQIESADECIVVLKTTMARYVEIEQHVLAIHPYETPCIVAVPVVDGSSSFLSWIADETSGR